MPPKWENIDFLKYPVTYSWNTTAASNINVQDCSGTINLNYVTQEDLDEFARKIFKIITEHVTLDITENEFMDLLED